MSNTALLAIAVLALVVIYRLLARAVELRKRPGREPGLTLRKMPRAVGEVRNDQFRAK